MISRGPSPKSKDIPGDLAGLHENIARIGTLADACEAEAKAMQDVARTLRGQPAEGAGAVSDAAMLARGMIDVVLTIEPDAALSGDAVETAGALEAAAMALKKDAT